MDKNVQKDFFAHNALAMSCSIDIRECSLDRMRSAASIQDYVIQLCKHLNLVRYGDCQVTQFAGGFTLVQLLESSNITGHFMSESGAVFIDIFSCKVFTPHDAADFTKEFFDGGEPFVRWIFRK